MWEYILSNSGYVYTPGVGTREIFSSPPWTWSCCDVSFNPLKTKASWRRSNKKRKIGLKGKSSVAEEREETNTPPIGSYIHRWIGSQPCYCLGLFWVAPFAFLKFGSYEFHDSFKLNSILCKAIKRAWWGEQEVKLSVPYTGLDVEGYTSHIQVCLSC